MSAGQPADAQDLFPVWLLRSKVSPTRQRVDLLDRHSHTLKLHQSLDARVSLIHGPAGYGKSTLLADWRKLLVTDGHKVCWLSLGRQDNDPMQLLTYIAFALATGGVSFSSEEAGVKFRLNDLSERELISLIIHFVAEARQQVVLILDDFENLEAAVIEQVIEPFIEYAPDNLHVSIATRDDSHLKIARLEAKGQAVRIGPAQLRFTPIELSDFLADEYDSQTIARFFKVTEGWPVAIQMIRSAIRSEGDIERILGDLRGDAAHIATYLSEEVLSSLDEQLQQFLMDISLVDRVACEFADYLREQPDSHVLFSRARTLDALVLPVDEVDATYRLHPLFREHLYARLGVSNPARQRSLHLRAAAWFAERGDLVEAVRHSIQAGDDQHGIDILTRAGGVMLWFKEGLTRLRTIMGMFDEETIIHDSRLALIRCLLDIKDGLVAQARQLHDANVARNQIAVHDLSQAGTHSSVHEFVVMEIVISIYEGKPISDQVLADLDRKVSTLGAEDHAIRGNLLTMLCVGHLQRGHFQAARRCAEQSLPAFLAGGSEYGAAYIYFHLGDISFAEGNSSEAARWYKMGLDSTRRIFSDDQGMKLVVNILISELDYELNQLTSGTSITRAVPRLLEKHEAWFDIYAAGYSTSAYLEFDDYGIEAALAIINRAVEYAELNKLFRLTRFLTCLRIDLLLRAGLTSKARAELEQSGIAIEDYQSASEDEIAWRERDAAVQVIVRLLLQEGEHQRALEILKYFSKQARHEGHVRARLRYKILRAIAHSHDADDSVQQAQLNDALGLFGKSRFVRPFLDEKAALAPMLETYLRQAEQQQRPESLRHHAQSLLEQMATHGEGEEEQSLLSPRELEVLQELVHGFSNKVIARKIDVTESTVRFHLRNIFVKLNVSSRLQAVAVARELQLL